MAVTACSFFTQEPYSFLPCRVIMFVLPRSLFFPCSGCCDVHPLYLDNDQAYLHCAASFPDGEDGASDGVVEVRMTVDESGDVSMLSGEVNKWFRLHAELPVETLMDPALLVANTHILFNPKRGDIKVGPATLAAVMQHCSAWQAHKAAQALAVGQS